MHRLSRFGQLMKGLPQGCFQRLVDEHQADRHVKRFGCWAQLTAMVYAHLAGVSGLRELEAGFNQHRNHHYHLGAVEVRRSTLADANDKRSPRVFEQAVRLLIASARNAFSRSERKEMLYLIDSTTIALHGRGAQWTHASKTRTRGLKLHVQLDSHAQVPVHFSITGANINDETEGSKIVPQEGATYVFDKGYCNYGWWEKIASHGARFVTRLKVNAALNEIECKRLDPAAPQILSDTVVRFTHASSRGGHRNACRRELRRLQVRRDSGEVIVLVTNDLESPAVQISELYRQRWQIELFFKWVKQHLKIKKFLGESQNAVRIQLLTALIAYLLVALAKMTNQLRGSLWSILIEIRTGLFTRAEEEVARWQRRRQRDTQFAAAQRELFT